MKKYLCLFAILIAFVAGCVDLSAPTVSMLDAKVTKVTLVGTQIDFVFEVQNKNPMPIDIIGYSYDISINNNKILSDKGEGFSVGASSAGKFDIPVFVRYDQVLSSVASVALNILSGKMEVDYQVDGKITGGTSGVTITQAFGSSGKIKIPKELLK